MHLVVKTQVAAAVKEASRKKGYGINSIDGSFLPAMNEKVMKIVEKAVERAHANQRKTLMDRDV